MNPVCWFFLRRASLRALLAVPGAVRAAASLSIVLTLAVSCAWSPARKAPEKAPEFGNSSSAQPNAPASLPGTPDLAGGPENVQRLAVNNPSPAAHASPRVFYSGSNRVRWVALTFDDGPDARFTPAILNTLRYYGVKATFFLTGQRAEAHPEIVRRIAAEGHEIGNHSYNHPKLVDLPPWKVRDQLARTHQILRRLTLKPVRLFRSPYGAVNPQILLDAQRLGYRTAHWSVDSQDWRSLPQDKVLANILPNVRPGSVILQHSAGGTGEDLTGTVRALGPLIRTLRLRGYRFVTVSEMMSPPQ